jgi:hypothetical protein
MALTNAQRQKRYRERRRKAKAKPPGQAVAVAMKRTFPEFINFDKDRTEAFDAAMKSLNTTHLGEWKRWIEDENAVAICRDLIGDTFGGAIMAIATVCQLVNEYKVEQLDFRLSEIEKAETNDPALQEAADRFMAYLRNVREQYQRRNRYDFMPMEVDGE